MLRHLCHRILTERQIFELRTVRPSVSPHRPSTVALSTADLSFGPVCKHVAIERHVLRALTMGRHVHFGISVARHVLALRSCDMARCPFPHIAMAVAQPISTGSSPCPSDGTFHQPKSFNGRICHQDRTTGMVCESQLCKRTSGTHLQESNGVFRCPKVCTGTCSQVLP
jgi:hypothetical protein